MKLRHRLILRTVSLAAVLFGLFGSILIYACFHLQFERERHALSSHSARLAQSLEAAAVNYSLQNIALNEDILADLLTQLDQTASLFDESGSLIFGNSSNPPAETGISIESRTLRALRSVRLAGCDYRLLTVSDLTPLYETRAALLLSYALLYAIMMLAFSTAMHLTAQTLSRPIERLAQVSAQLASGQTAVRAQPDDTQETHALAVAFNRMTDSLTGQIDRRNRFIAALSHEIKTPLTAIIGHADLIRSGRAVGDDALLAAHSILTEGQRLNSLAARLMEWILLEEDGARLAPLPVRPLLEETAEALRPLADERRVCLAVRCTDAIILCDRPLFSSLLFNLIDNALKSGAEHILAEGRTEGDLFILAISDDGRGMDADSLTRITEPFYRVDKSRSRAQGGAGLGLSLCARIAELHNARLSFESTPGKGTRVTLIMPGKEADPIENA